MDDAPLIYDLQSKLGGTVVKDYNAGKRQTQLSRKPTIRWSTNQASLVKSICEAILSHCPIPAKKLDDVQNVLDFLNWFMVTDQRHPEFQSTAEHYFLRSQELKAYRPAEDS
jgi:hypothetical protein